MKSDDQRDQLVDMLLRELVGGETPPDVRERVLDAVTKLPSRPPTYQHRAPVRRAIRPRQQSRSSGATYGLMALLATVAVAMVYLHLREIGHARTPVVTRVSGSVDRTAGALQPGESLSTGAASSAVLTYPDGTTVDLAAETTLRVSACSWIDRSKGLDLIQGRIVADVKPQTSGHPMLLSSEGANAEVVGTKLSFQHDDEGTRLEVTEGTVRFIPSAGDTVLLVKSGLFAAAGKSGVHSGAIHAAPRPAIVRFTLMNADSGEPLREAALSAGEIISLASLPTQNINIRADFEGDTPTSVRILVTRSDGKATGMAEFMSKDQTQPPFFAAGDYWAEGRPNDCRAWTPRPGRYHISAEAVYSEDRGRPLEMDFQITE
ncbi:MAG: FecR domain-containing protein [Verrucomicrobiales bacterium]|nr:FecR domain-containing protein [Verrucomicrobiales bacterium]MCP5560757.1 FecR domain-containing protein [Verrucomicrobiaceae bacterium]